MRICIITNLYPPHVRGGAERVAHRIARGFVSRGHSVSVITTKPDGGLEETFEEGIKIYRFKPSNLYYTLEDREQKFIRRLLWHVFDLFARESKKKVLELLKEIKPDVVMTHNLKGIGLSVAKSFQKHVPHVHVLHDVQLVVPSGLLIHGDEDHWMNKGLAHDLYVRLAKWALGNPAAVISPSKFLLDFHLDRSFFPETETYVLPNPAPDFGIETRRRPQGALKVLFLGSLEAHKGIEFLIQALTNSRLEFELTIAGRGSMDKEIKTASRMDPRISFFGAFNKEEAAALLASSDCLVAPSLCYENSPTVIYESLSCGVPVVASRIGGIPELVKDGENGYLFDPCSSQDLIKKLGWVLEEREEWFEAQDEIRMNISKFAMTYYLDKIEEILKQVTK